MSSKSSAIQTILNEYFSPLIVRFLEQSNTKSVVVEKGGYRAASPALRRMGIDVDSWCFGSKFAFQGSWLKIHDIGDARS